MPKINNQPLITSMNNLTKTKEQIENPKTDECQTVSLKEVKQSISEKKSCYPACKLQRNECGLIENLNYEFDELGFVNYKKLIPREFLVPNKQFFQNRKIPVPDSIENLTDKEMIVLLNGYKILAAIRGFKSVDHQIISASQESVTIQTKISWIGNYETGFRSVDYTALATASLKNTHSFCKDFLAEIAQNRGEVRAIRGFLRIPILGSDELGPQNEEDNNSKNDSNPAGPHSVLQKKMTEKNITFDKIKLASVNKNISGADKWNSVLDIPVGRVIEILNQIAVKETSK